MKNLGLVVFLLVGLLLVASSCAPGARPAEPREPKKLEAKITIVTGEDKERKDGMFLATAEGVTGRPFRLPAGKRVGIHIVNKATDEHEVMFGRKVKMEHGEAHGYEVMLFEKLDADMFVYPSGKKVEIEGVRGFEEIELEDGADIWIRVTFPLEAKGEWEIGCFIQEEGKPSHYDEGMKGVLVIE